jgi:RNA polymerase sigma-70 factor, ECF subfamily
MIWTRHPRRRKDSRHDEHVQIVSTVPDILGPLSAESWFRSLFDDHFADIWSYARRRCDSSQDADDAAAETFAIAWRRRDEMPRADARLWLFGVARKVLAGYRRSFQREDCTRRRLSETRKGESPPSRDYTLEDAVAEALATLPADDRDLLLMRAWDGLSVGEIATILGCTPNAVSIRLFKTREKMARALKQKDIPASRHVAGGSLAAGGEQS